MHNDIFLPKCWYCCSWLCEVSLMNEHSAALVERCSNLERFGPLDWTLLSTVPLSLYANTESSIRAFKIQTHLHRQWTSSHPLASTLPTYGCSYSRSGIRWVRVHGWEKSVWTVTPNADRANFRKKLPDAYFDSSVCGQSPFLPPSKTCIYTTIALPSSTSLHFGSPASRVPAMPGRRYERNWLVWWVDTLHDHVRSMPSLPPIHDLQLGFGLADTLIRVNRKSWWIITAIALSFDCQCELRSTFTNPV